MKRRDLEAIQQAIAEVGLDLLSVEQTKHVKVWVGYAGQRALWVLATTPGDKRTWLNCRSDLRRIAHMLKCRAPALSLVVPDFGIGFVGLQTSIVPQRAARRRNFLCPERRLCLVPSLPKLGRSR